MLKLSIVKRSIVKRQFVSLFHSLKCNRKIYYWVPTNTPEYNKNYLIEQKCKFINSQECKKTQELIKEINDKLLNQEKNIEGLRNGVSSVFVVTYAFIFSSFAFVTIPSILLG